MTACGDTHRMLARLADGSGADVPTVQERAELEAHLAECAECGAALEEQRLVSEILRSRPALAPSAAFARRLASRLDDASGWLGILDWRTWTFRLAPVAVALAIAALFAGTSSTPEASTATLDAWTRSVAEPSSVASAVWQEGTSSDALLETMLTGAGGGTRETSDVR
jgi:anti-sigma factor RsiW